MTVAMVLAEMARNKEVIYNGLLNVPEVMYRWKPTPEKWCLLEIICHLVDEEVEDFRTRIEHVLAFPNTPFPPIAPEQWVTERKYITKNYEETITLFTKERTKSLTRLQNLKNANWQHCYQHPHFGKMTANMLLMNWLMHDYLHIRQIIRLKNEYLRAMTKENLDYAGNW